ncbi:MAG: hypothetical protein KGJ49_00690 [Alphaproteobacteria bacterium]|nr:hypothetical protein [Alphaproteobacteria bacterium]
MADPCVYRPFLELGRSIRSVPFFSGFRSARLTGALPQASPYYGANHPEFTGLVTRLVKRSGTPLPDSRIA